MKPPLFSVEIMKKLVSIILVLSILLITACSYKEKHGGFAKMDFGHQKDKPVTWLVILEDDETKVLLSEQILDVHKYNEKDEKLDWEKTTLHEYLNTDFVNEYFTSDEKEKMVFTNDMYDDLVTMLSINNLLDLYGNDDDSNIYYVKDGYYGDKDFFEANQNIVAKPAELALYNEIDVFDNETFAEIMRTEVDKRYDFANGCAAYWILNQVDDTISNAFLVTATGYIGNAEADTDYIGIRPIIRIRK